jgi:hypothetical protein
MNHFVTFGFVFLLASLALAVVLDADLALGAIDRLVQSEVYTDMQKRDDSHGRPYPILTKRAGRLRHVSLKSRMFEPMLGWA